MGCAWTGLEPEEAWILNRTGWKTSFKQATSSSYDWLMPYDELVTYTGHSSGGPYQLTMIGLKVKNKLQQEWVDFYYDWVRDPL